MYMSAASNGNLYYTAMGGLFKATYKDKRYLEGKKLGGGVGAIRNTAHPFIAPDESYILFDAKDSARKSKLFVSFKQKDGSWGKAHALPASVNATGTEICSSISPDGKYFFFQREGDIWWVDAKIIKENHE